jgi:hypothetical protein
VLHGSRKHLAHGQPDVNFLQNPHIPPIQSQFTLKSVNTWHRFSGVSPPLYIDSLVIASAVTIPHTAQSMQGSDSWYAERPHSDMVG